ncbi:hypothetical protein HK099_005570 [Clydaea vesicula]|uniref:mRNA turnover protein 4 n=1 Tax=Clydaea vesicula TaxID=447962 RepID=A0AAD5UA64_9FUNG|nr:hypothetical protein HK099_005570 [Clydaea vesicula]
MPKSKRQKIVNLTKTSKKGKEGKDELVSLMREACDTFKHCYIFKVNNMRNNYLKDVRNEWNTSRFFFGKNKVMAKAFGNSPEDEYKSNISSLSARLVGNVGLLFTNSEPEAVLEYFNKFEKQDYARAGIKANETVVIPAGPVVRGEDNEKFPHNMESQLRHLGMTTSLVNGVVTNQKPHTICKKGETLSAEQAQLLKHFYYQMAVFKISILSHWCDGKLEILAEDEVNNEDAESILGKLGVLEFDLESYNVDWMKKYKGKSEIVLRPKSVQEVSEVLKYCNSENLAVCPQGGNTGLVGGGVSVFDEIIIQLGRMNEIRSFDEQSGVAVCDAGVILENLDNFVGERGYMCPLDLGAKGTCQIGGNISTNAGGLRLLRYGSLHGTVLGLEVVLADGTVLNNLSMLRKDNTGLDLKQLFIGAEGSLGIVTGVSILTPKKPNSVNVALLAVPNYEFVLENFKLAKSHLGEILSAFEFFDSKSLQLVLKHLNQLRNPLPNTEDSKFYVLLETHGSNFEHDQEKIEMFLEAAMEKEFCSNGSLAQGEGQVRDIWAIREGIPEACGKEGAVYKYDISLPLKSLYSLCEVVEKKLINDKIYLPNDFENSLVKQVLGYGHVGDGNIHLNISAKQYDSRVLNSIEPFVYEFTKKNQGSISAEHGLGVMKGKFISYSKSDEMITVMKNIKNLLDPNGIMNPYKFLV